MALDKVTLNLGTGGKDIGVDNISNVDYEVVKGAFGVAGDLQLVADGNPLPVKNQKPSASSTTSVNDSNMNQTLLAANVNRLGATIYNNSSAILYVILGTNATTSLFTVKMVSEAYYEVPFSYVGEIDGIWASSAGGTALLTELS